MGWWIRKWTRCQDYLSILTAHHIHIHNYS
jgi:hypothetical protein